MKHTRVLFVTRSLQSAPGGMQTATRLLIAGLRGLPDIDLRVCGWSGPKWALPWFFARAAAAVLFFRGDVVHFGDAAFAPVIALAKMFRPRLRMTCTAHGLDLTYPHPLYHFLLGGLKRCDAVVAVSAATAAVAEARGAKSVIVIPWGVQPAALAERIPGPPHLLSVGRQIPRKGTAWFLEHVLPKLIAKAPDMQYTVIGDGPESGKLRVLVRSLWLQDNVRLAGVLSDGEKVQQYAVADLHVMPNVSVSGDMEGFGMACVEAAAHGLPTVAAKLEGIADAVIDGETGVFFQPGDADHAAAVIFGALEHRWSRLSVQRSCRRHYDIATVASRYANELFAPAADRDADGR